jgi:hypothetical protein
MWYKLAQNAEKAFETLKEKGVSQDNISKLQEMTDLALRGKYIGALMQNPLMSWNELEEKLKCYTNPERNKKYYEKNSNIVKEKAKTYYLSYINFWKEKTTGFVITSNNS